MKIFTLFALVLYMFNPGTDYVSQETDYSKTLKGRFILKDAQCAGFEFLGGKEVIWRNEITCSEPDTFLIYWVDKKSFILKDKKAANGSKDCPPRNWYYSVSRYDGKSLDLKELWTGWGEYKTTISTYTKKNK